MPPRKRSKRLCLKNETYENCNEKIIANTSEKYELVINDESTVDAENTPMKSKDLFDVDSSDFNFDK